MCKPVVKKFNKFLRFILPNNVLGITLAPFGIYLDDSYLLDITTINHESIHWKQQMEMGIVLFYLWYGIEWIIKLFIFGKAAYYNISFERESYKHEHDLEYLNNRKHFSWFKYLYK